MVVVEFFSTDAAKNWVATWVHSPERVILVGDNEQMLIQAKEHYQTVAEEFDRKTRFSYQTLPLTNVDEIFNNLDSLLQTYGECTFDLLGGSEYYLAAVGKLSKAYPDRAKLYRYDKNTSLLPQISLEEWVRVYGGSIVFAPERPNATVRWDWNEVFVEDLFAMWEICRQNVSRWNFQIGFLSRARVRNSADGSLHRTVYKTLSSRDETQYLDMKLLRDLHACGVIEILHEQKNEVRFRFKNEAVKKTFCKEGQLLELVMAATAKLCRNAGDQPVYNDVLTGVTLDWDGVHDVTSRNVDNEIDVFMISGITPVFVSCKNGDISTDELFKLYTVARRFGGDRAKTVLIAPKIDALGDRGKSLAARAQALSIHVVSNVEHMTREERIKAVTAFCKEV